MRKRRSPNFVFPPHANAEVHRRIMEKLSKMTKEQLAQTVVDAGICTPEGELTEHYRDPDEMNVVEVFQKTRKPPK